MISLKQPSTEVNPLSFTFVTAVGTAELSETAAREMRSHVTRSNFAKRRARLSKTRAEKETTSACKVPLENVLQRIVTSGSAPRSSQTLCQEARKDGYTRYLSSKWSLLFLDGSEYPATANEATWISLLMSEPALVESSMAFGLRHWSPDSDYQQIACQYSSKATENIIQRIGSGRAATDAVVAAVLTMAFGERLVHNDLAWNIHIDGAVQMVNERIHQGLPALPPLLETILIVDTINDVFEFPRFYHRKFISTARTVQGARYSTLIRLADICEDLARWMRRVNTSRECPQSSSFIMEHIMQPMHDILSQTQALRAGTDATLRASCIAVELIIYLSWGSPNGAVDLTTVASELKEAIYASQFRPCCYSDLTSCQLMIGAMAADEGSPVRAWFIGRLKGAWRVVKSRGCSDVMDILERNMRFKTSLNTRFKSLWMELDSQSIHQFE
ncbi:hypothetical protein F5Y07DRAFT_393013 [Xylaria sp. FL0933]|nr:hypothetical protein F5Y07DRAFT_393013 [Xylaria sp. FL0933]